MKNLTVLSIAILLVASSCTTKKHVSSSTTSAKAIPAANVTSSIVYASSGDTLKKIIGYKKNGKLSYIEFQRNNVPDSLYMHWFDEEDKIMERVEYKNGKRNGKSEEWFTNGQKKSFTMYEAGLKNGETTEWYENGQKKSEGSWMYEKKNEKWTYWNEKGELVKTESWFEGNLKDK